MYLYINVCMYTYQLGVDLTRPKTPVTSQNLIFTLDQDNYCNAAFFVYIMAKHLLMRPAIYTSQENQRFSSHPHVGPIYEKRQ